MASKRALARLPQPAGPAEPEASFTTNLVFFGATSLKAREIRTLLDARGFLAGQVRLYDKEGEGAICGFGGEALVVTTPDEEAMVGVDIAFMCGSAAETVPYLGWAESRGFVAIDLSGATSGQSDVPFVHTEINPDSISARTQVIAAPHPVCHNLATLVAAIGRAGRLATVQSLALRPASDLGDKGIDELYKQTVGLLNFSQVSQETFGRQLAFNVLPSSAVVADPVQGFDRRMQEDTARLLGMDPARVSLVSAFVPMFHVHILAVTLEFEAPPDLESLRSLAKATRGIRLVEDPDVFSPVELAGEEAVAILDLRADPHRPACTRLWGVCDNLKGGAALNAVRIAERVADLRRREVRT